MKRTFCTFLILILILANSAFADTPTYDHSILEMLPGYSYDKFDKTWYCFGAYVKELTDATVVVGVDASGNSTAVDGVSICCWIRDKYNRVALYDLEKLMILADDTLITCKLFMGDDASAAILTPSSIDALRLIAGAKTLSFKLISANDSFTFNPDISEVTDMQIVAKVFYDLNLVDYYKDGFSSFIDTFYPTTIE